MISQTTSQTIFFWLFWVHSCNMWYPSSVWPWCHNLPMGTSASASTLLFLGIVTVWTKVWMSYTEWCSCSDHCWHNNWAKFYQYWVCCWFWNAVDWFCDVSNRHAMVQPCNCESCNVWWWSYPILSGVYLPITTK
jgi:hypothetical protein